MIGAITAQTWRSTLRDGRFRLLAAVMLILALASGFSGWSHNRVQAAERIAAAEADQRNWLNQGSVNPHNAAHFGRWVPKPVAPLAFFDPGLEPQLGQLVRLEAHRQDPARSRPSEGSTALASFAAVTPAFVLQTLVPLLAILNGFSAFAGDRSRILLRQELAGGARTTDLLAGRLLGSGAALLLVMAVPLVIAAAVVIGGGRAEALATDIAPGMIERLQARLVDGGFDKTGCEARVMDTQALDLPSDGFDAAFSVFGVMLFPD